MSLKLYFDDYLQVNVMYLPVEVAKLPAEFRYKNEESGNLYDWATVTLIKADGSRGRQYSTLVSEGFLNSAALNVGDSAYVRYIAEGDKKGNTQLAFGPRLTGDDMVAEYGGDIAEVVAAPQVEATV